MKLTWDENGYNEQFNEYKSRYYAKKYAEQWQTDWGYIIRKGIHGYYIRWLTINDFR